MKNNQNKLGILAAVVALGGLTLQSAASPFDNRVRPVKDGEKSAVGASAEKSKKETARWGKFVSFKAGTLTLKGNTGALVWRDFPVTAAVVRWDDPRHQYAPAGTVQVLSEVDPGTWVFVSEDKKLIRIGAAAESHVSGTFISFKEDRLRMVGKNLGNYAREGGTEINFKAFPEGVPVYKTAAGKKPSFIGPAETVLRTIKEGSMITVYGEGDDNFTRIEIAEHKK